MIQFCLGLLLGACVTLYLKDCLTIDIKFDKDEVKTQRVKFKENIGENEQD